MSTLETIKVGARYLIDLFFFGITAVREFVSHSSVYLNLISNICNPSQKAISRTFVRLHPTTLRYKIWKKYSGRGHCIRIYQFISWQNDQMLTGAYKSNIFYQQSIKMMVAHRLFHVILIDLKTILTKKIYV